MVFIKKPQDDGQQSPVQNIGHGNSLLYNIKVYPYKLEK
jgi:hypothetical protein